LQLSVLIVVVKAFLLIPLAVNAYQNPNDLRP
jgi:hypothetical protein